jgi:hypothetical protein
MRGAKTLVIASLVLAARQINWNPDEGGEAAGD